MHAGLLILIMLAAVPAVIAQTQPQTVQQMRERQLQQLQQEAATLPEQKADSISDVLKISIEDNLLTAKSLISSDVSEMRIVAPKLRGVARIKWYPSPQQDTDRSGRFLLIIDNPNDPESGHVIATVSAIGGRFVLARDSEADDRVDSVQYIQAPPAPPGTPYVESTVKLYVTHKGDADQSKQVDLKLAADTFTQLRAEHQAEVDRFLRPFLRDLGQEA